MAQSVVQVRAVWEDVTGTPLRADHRAAFLRRPEAAAIAALPRLVIELAASTTVARCGALRLSTWLDAAVAQRATAPPLRIELVPSTCWWSNLRSELPAEQWAVCKRWSSQRASRRCEICGECGPRWPVECHERWQYLDDDRPRVQRLVGLISLCPACHQATHMGFASVSGHLDQAMAHLAGVNGWTPEQCAAHLADSESVWESRSRYEWTLDVDWLAQALGIDVVVKRPAALS